MPKEDQILCVLCALGAFVLAVLVERGFFPDPTPAFWLGSLLLLCVLGNMVYHAEAQAGAAKRRGRE